ncbi:hypothetical protein [Streptomyces sp. NBC_01601]|uniref:hypothetical protein n=1 Tax=Streptomyces sp. NBC_01601 TaxID=2975892 RepID=UPI002E2A38C2|nr:hypothetical protein [Streptomyces sp. NBC_01601]
MKTREEVIAAFAKLPPKITASQIAEATGRAHIHNWSDANKGFVGFPEATREGRTDYRDRDEVLEWYLDQSFSQAPRRGPRDLTDITRTARPPHTHLSASELADLLTITRRGVNKYADKYSPDATDDPFPLADGDGKRSWSAVRAWLLRHADPLPKPGADGRREWSTVQVWLTRNRLHTVDSLGGRVFRDELGLTVGHRDVIERVRVARAAGESVPAQWIADVLDLDDAEQAEQLLQGAPAGPAPARRLGPTVLSRELGVTLEQVRHYAKTRTPETSADPFPEKDGRSARDPEEVRAWFARNGVATASA